ncbi:ATP-binding protein [Sphaerisporangium krabiense]|uniref:Anti-sigma regulatory factor (Ser/Thr protein kinase) n=1 Tax=Sphaerisporangium krabiense TaxID=763782 RepID=A0A7W9DPV3_9ACTN|nr:ATP-binding protein [Sphaerisporangium krabiense]MBB5626856.1 anti-sigma regulatory factor (Ser/Thr protein kinase) [Sphaerisporangium krabiense]
MTAPTNSRKGTGEWQQTFLGRVEQVRAVRRFVKTHLPDHADADLIASELATNAVEHTHTGQPGGTFTATVKHHPDGTAYIEIADQGGPIAFGARTSTREGGRGLHLVTALTTTWGVKGDAAGRIVWAELPPPTP